MAPSEDSELARLASGGAEGAFEAIFGRYGSDVFGFCCGMAGAKDGEELFRVAAGSAMARLRQGVHRGDLKPWLLKCAYEADEAFARPGEQGAERLGADALAAHPQVAGDGALVEIADAFRRLSRTQRGGLVLRELSGLGYEAVGGILEIPPA